MSVVSVTEARKTLYRLLDEVAESHEPIHINGKRHNAVLISEEDWNSVCETLYLDAIPGMRESIIKGLKIPVSKCARKIDW